MPRRNAGRSEKVVRLRLHDVADADELRMRGDALELRVDVVRLQIDPADDAGDERMRVGQREQPARFLERLPRLHRDAGVEARRAPSRAARRRAGSRAAARAIESSIQPVLGGVVAPEMLVRVDPIASPSLPVGIGVAPRALDS